MYCGKGVLVKEVEGREWAFPLPCRCWNCENCQPGRRRELLALAASGTPNKLLTLTINPAIGESPANRLALLHDAWRKLKKRAMRRFGWKSLPYMAFIEATKRGEPHLHILLRCGFLPQRWISDQMRDLARSPIVDIRQIKNVRTAVLYVAKYVTKAPAQFGNHKRYWYSQDYQINQGEVEEVEKARKEPTTFVMERWEDYILEKRIKGYYPSERGDGWYDFFHITELIQIRAGPQRGAASEG